MGELLRCRTLEPVLLVYQAVGGEEGSAASDACPGTTGIRLEAMERPMALWQTRHLQWLPSESAKSLTARRPSGIGLITLSTKQAGKPSAGKQPAGFDVAGTGNQLTVRILRHSQRKRRDPARLNLRSMAPVLDPTAQTPRRQSGGLQSAEERSPQTRQQR